MLTGRVPCARLSGCTLPSGCSSDDLDDHLQIPSLRKRPREEPRNKGQSQLPSGMPTAKFAKEPPSRQGGQQMDDVDVIVLSDSKSDSQGVMCPNHLVLAKLLHCNLSHEDPLQGGQRMPGSPEGCHAGGVCSNPAAVLRDNTIDLGDTLTEGESARQVSGQRRVSHHVHDRRRGGGKQ